ncbi:MAG: hypothetical protein ABSF44_04730 [Candidatus Bathyarchaeia archaeon]|jgi:hypothetical protein
MAIKPKKYSLGYTIFTDSKLDEKIYIARSYEIQGAFITFEPQLEITKTKTQTVFEGTKVTLPECVIKEIIFHEIDEEKS